MTCAARGRRIQGQRTETWPLLRLRLPSRWTLWAYLLACVLALADDLCVGSHWRWLNLLDVLLRCGLSVRALISLLDLLHYWTRSVARVYYPTFCSEVALSTRITIHLSG